jgi:hypothetical protein
MESVLYPMTLGRNQSWLRKPKPASGRWKFLLSFRTGERPRFPDYGTRLEDIEQSPELDVIAPQQLIVLQIAAKQYITDIRLLAVTVDIQTIPDRKVLYEVVFEVPGETGVRREQFQTDLRYQS